MSAQSVTEPIPQFHDRDGQPLDGGFVYVGTAGLDAQANQIQLYLDPALTIPLAQPVQTLNGYPSNGGTPVAFYAAVGDFSIKILDANGTLVLSAPNVTTRLDASNLTGSISSALISFLQFGTGAQTRTVESKLRDVVSVFDFMTSAQVAAVKAGTFLVDVTAQIQAAINSGAREVYFPQGGYSVTNDGTTAPAIIIGATSVGVSLVGAGRQATVIRNQGGGPAIASVGNLILKNTSIRIADMSIEGQVGTQEGVLLDYTAIAVLERLDCYANGGAGIRIKDSVRVAVNDCWSRSNTGNGLAIESSSFFVDVKGGTFEANTNGIVVGNGGGTACRHITLTGAALTGNTGANASILDGSADVRFLGCNLTATGAGTTHHVYVDGVAGTAAGVLVDGCTLFGVGGTIGVYAARCSDVTVSNSVIDCPASNAFNIDATALGTRIINNAILAGSTVDASASTSQIIPDGGQYLIRRNVAYTGPTTIDMGDGEVRMNSALIAQLFRFYALFAVGLLAVQRWDDRRVWFSPLDGRMYAKSASDPTFTNDGDLVNSGVTTSYARGALPAPGGLTLGRIIRGTGYAGGAAWGAVEVGIGPGADAYLFVGVAGGWRVFAQAS